MDSSKECMVTVQRHQASNSREAETSSECHTPDEPRNCAPSPRPSPHSFLAGRGEGTCRRSGAGAPGLLAVPPLARRAEDRPPKGWSVKAWSVDDAFEPQAKLNGLNKLNKLIKEKRQASSLKESRIWRISDFRLASSPPPFNDLYFTETSSAAPVEERETAMAALRAQRQRVGAVNCL